MARTLYICYFGVREPLVQTQVLPYLRELRKRVGGNDEGGIFPLDVSLLTFEPAYSERDRQEFETIRRELTAEGIGWDWLPYHKRPSAIATAWDIFRGAFYIWRLIGRFDVLHGRVHIPTLMGALARKFSRRKPKLLFDIRGFFPEEYTDAGIWPKNGSLYRGAKRVEQWLMKESDGFVVLTEKAREILFPETRETGLDTTGRPVEVIPCCVDFDNRFAGDPAILRQQVRAEMRIEGRKVIVHLGALGGLYLTEEIADLLAASRMAESSTFAMFLTQSDPAKIIPLLKERGFTERDYFVKKVPASDIQKYLEAADIGISIVKATFATQSRSPTKIPEYLACGLPIIANAGVGDVDTLIEINQVGVLVREFSEEAYRNALGEIEGLGSVSERCRETARRAFDLETVGGARYRRLYANIIARK